jgi:hypothetical protein
MKNLLRAIIASAAFAALFVVPSIASASPELTSPTGTRAPVGTLFTATNVAHGATTKTFKTTLSAGTMECATATFTGEVIENTGTSFVGTISTFELKGTPAEPNANHCASPFGATTVTPNHTSNPSHNGVASLPWCIKANALNDQFTIYGCTNGQARAITIVYHAGGIGACTYQKAFITGTYTTHPADAILTIAEQEFTKVTGNAFCPTSFKIDLALTMTKDVSGAEGEALYIK